MPDQGTRAPGYAESVTPRTRNTPVSAASQTAPAEPGTAPRAKTTAEAAAEPRWLTEQERAGWLATVALMSRLPAALDARMQSDAGLNFFDYMVLAMLSEQPDRTLQMSELAAVTSASLSRLSHVATRLERQGLLQRRRVPGAGRRTTATLTDTGLAKVVQTAPEHVAAVREFFLDGLTADELATLHTVGVKMTTRLAANVNSDSADNVC
jgi:DNA-binding MarR family transcriptional regulator